MSVASSIPRINIPNPSSSASPSSSSSTASSSCLRFSTTARRYVLSVRNSQTDGPIRRPMAPPLREPTAPPSLKPTPPTPPPPLQPTPPTPPSQTGSTVAPPQPQPVKPAAVVLDDKTVVTLEFQRQKAKELQDYFKQQKLEETNQGPFFGFIGKNEIANGRWAMFGFAVGMLTEYATGSDFVDQVKILLSNFGIVDLD